MMQWDSNVSSSDIGGILKRKTSKVDNTNSSKDLLIFGYAAKIFRDDSKALIIDQGKHLLEWNGEKIDRYDVRATLLDSSKFEPPPGGYGNRLDYLPAEELRAELLAEEERYYALNHNEEEELMYQEEELKRLLHEKKSTYGQVKFDYNSEQDVNTSEDNQDLEQQKVDEPEKPYVQPVNFNIPYSILLPETMNQHIIIEKTARFISGQGPQMEILLKAKQSNNPKFEFLTQSNKFNPYYKFILNSIKNGTYPEDFSSEGSEINKCVVSEHCLNNVSDKKESLNEPIIPNIQYKPSPNCAYTQLISKIKGVPLPEVVSKINLNLNKCNENAVTKNVVEDKQSSDVCSDEVEVKNISSSLMLAQAYMSDSGEESESYDIPFNKESNKFDPNFLKPPENIRTVIDKTASYVVKNGKQFEETLKMKGDDRFKFLSENNEYYVYYMNKVHELYSLLPSQSKKKRIIPVSFSIKPKDETTVQIKPVLPQEGSDDESQIRNDNSNEHISNAGNNQHNSTVLPEHVKKAIQLVENQLVARNNLQSIFSKPSSSNTNKNSKTVVDFSQNRNIPSLTYITPSFNLNQKTSIEKQKELKLAEEKIKDRLAQMAREKVGFISKEKQLQLERKKKAIAFLNHIKDCNTTSTVTKLKVDNNSNSDNESIHSIPMSSHENEKIDAEQKNMFQSKLLSSQSKKDHINDDSDVISTSSANSESSKTLQKKLRYGSPFTDSRSRSRSHKRKKTKHYHRHHSKKKSKKRSRSRTRSKPRSASPSLEHLKRHTSVSSKKSKKHKSEKTY